MRAKVIAKRGIFKKSSLYTHSLLITSSNKSPPKKKLEHSE